MSDLFGWDLVYKVSEGDLNKKEDVLILFIHYMLIKSGYKCIGAGADKVLTGEEKASETLPPGWSSSANYSLRYVSKDQLFILKGITMDGNMIVNFLDIKLHEVSSIAFAVNDAVSGVKGKIEDILPLHAELMSKIKKDLIGPLTEATNSEASTQTQTSRGQTSQGTSGPDNPEPDPLMVGGQRGRYPDIVEPYWVDPFRDPLRVGHNDLDPLGRGLGGGMLFDPFGPGRGTGPGPDPGLGVPGGLPRGSIPPGARFDPFGPPAPPGRPRPFPPDSGIFPPPGGPFGRGGGGMFM